LKSRWEEESEEDPSDYFWAWELELEAFAHEFRYNKAIHGRFAASLTKLRQIIDQLKKSWQNKEGDLEAAKESDELPIQRSVFEDVDGDV